MIKKIMGYLVLLVIFAGLVWGGVNRTVAKWENENVEFSSANAGYSEDGYLREIQQNETVQATVESVKSGIWTLRLADGSLVEVEGRSLTYAIQRGFVLEEGDDLTISGFYDVSGNFELSEVINHTQGNNLVLRNEFGNPLWGKGGGGGGGGGGVDH